MQILSSHRSTRKRLIQSKRQRQPGSSWVISSLVLSLPERSSQASVLLQASLSHGILGSVRSKLVKIRRGLAETGRSVRSHRFRFYRRSIMEGVRDSRPRTKRLCSEWPFRVDDLFFLGKGRGACTLCRLLPFPFSTFIFFTISVPGHNNCPAYYFYIQSLVFVAFRKAVPLPTT